MGSTTVNGVIKQTPYGLLKNINPGLQPITALVKDSAGLIRDWPVRKDQFDSGVAFYLNDTIKLMFRAPSQSASATICELWRVNPSTGAETLDTSVTFTAVRQKAVNIAVTAINGGSGALTTSVTYDV